MCYLINAYPGKGNPAAASKAKDGSTTNDETSTSKEEENTLAGGTGKEGATTGSSTVEGDVKQGTDKEAGANADIAKQELITEENMETRLASCADSAGGGKGGDVDKGDGAEASPGKEGDGNNDDSEVSAKTDVDGVTDVDNAENGLEIPMDGKGNGAKGGGGDGLGKEREGVDGGRTTEASGSSDAGDRKSTASAKSGKGASTKGGKDKQTKGHQAKGKGGGGGGAGVASAGGASKAGRKKAPVFLFFSVHQSGQFCGAAQLMGPLEHRLKKVGCMLVGWLKDFQF